MSSMRKIGCFQWGCIVILVISLLLLFSCTKREFRKYVIADLETPNFVLTARIDGTYHRHEKIQVGSPYSLFIAITPFNKSDLQVRNLSLNNSGGEVVLFIQEPSISEHPATTMSESFFFFEETGLNIEYQDYYLEFDVKSEGRLLKKVHINFKKDYSERRMNNWWEDASSI